MPVTSLIGGVTSLVGGALQSGAAKKAGQQASAADTAAATSITNAAQGAQASGQTGINQANTAIAGGSTAADTAIASGLTGATGDIANAGTQQQNIYQSETGGLSPYQAAGTSGLTNLASMAGTFQAPTAAQAAATPGYEFQLQQGLKALNNSAATSGMLQSGANMKADQQYAQGLASTNYQNVYNNSLSTFNANQQGYQTLANLGTTANSQQLQAGSTYGGQIGNLASLGTQSQMTGAQLGTQAGLATASLGANTALQGNEYIGTSGLQGSEAAGEATEKAGSALAAGTMGQGNAWASAVNGVGNAAEDQWGT